MKCGNATEAYKTAYDTKTESTARINGSKLLTKTNIQEYIDELNKEIKENNIADINDCLKLLTEMMGEDKKDIVRLKAVDMRLKTLGAYLETKELNGDINITIGIDEE